MAIALREREQTKRPVRASLRPPPPLPLRKSNSCGMGDDDPKFPQWMKEQEERCSEEEGGETAFGCDYPDGPLSATGCPW